MFANAQESNDSNDMTLTNTNNQRSVSPRLNNTRRNLFGIRLNHDQLKQDLKDMWADQIDRQNKNWGFDFENLKPLNTETQKVCTSPRNNNPRFQWTKVCTKLNPFYNETGIKQDSHMLTSLGKDEIVQTESEYETDEEFDDALVIPTFYKYQRREKMNQEQNCCLKLIQLAQQTSKKQNSTNAFSKLNNSGLKQAKNVSIKNGKGIKASKVVHRPNARKATQNPNLIITFSENRKDTLRSAVSTLASESTSKSSSKDIGKMFTKATGSLGGCSAFKQPLKQQSILDMLKQRKRKNTSVQEKGTAAKHDYVLSTQHNLRPRTASIN